MSNIFEVNYNCKPNFSDKNDQEELFEAILSGKFDFPSPYWNDVSQEAKVSPLSLI